MNERARVLARQRERLVRRSGLLRDGVATDLQRLQPVFLWADRIQDAGIWLRTHSLAVAAGGLLVAAWRPRRLLSWGLRAWSAWRLVQRLRAPGPGR